MRTAHELGVAIALALVAAATTVHVPPPSPVLADSPILAAHRRVGGEDRGRRDGGGNLDRQSEATGQATGPATRLVIARPHGGHFVEQASRWAISLDFGERRCGASLLLVEDFGELPVDRALAADVEEQVRAWCILGQDNGAAANELESPEALSATGSHRAPEPH